MAKPKKKALKQAKRWFNMNPNRLSVNVKLSKIEVFTVLRKDIIK